MIGNRIRLARMANGLSLQQLSDCMKKRGVAFTKTSLYNYESNITIPNEQILDTFADVLGVNKHFFTHDTPKDFSFHLNSDLGSVESRRQEILSYIQIQLEYLISVLDTAREAPFSEMGMPEQTSVNTNDEAEAVADSLRKLWSIGDLPIASVCSLLEHNGWFLFELPELFNWDYISGVEASHNIHFIFFSRDYHVDELRMGLLKEFGKHLMSYPPSMEEELLGTFASSLLFSHTAVMQDVGAHRTVIDRDELKCLKQKYGISRIEMLKRLEYCGVISSQTHYEIAQRLNQSYFIARSYLHIVHLNFFEEPTRINLLVRRILAEGKIPGEDSLDYSRMI